jgi:hypothetical protein
VRAVRVRHQVHLPKGESNQEPANRSAKQLATSFTFTERVASK